MSSASVGEELAEEARKFVKQSKNSVYNPVLFTSEVAEELGVSEEEAYEVLDTSTYVEKMEIDECAVWW